MWLQNHYFNLFRTYPNIHKQVQSAQVNVDGPAFVRVVIWCWQWKQVNVTGPSLNSSGTTNWVATGGGALCVGPTSTKCIYKKHLIWFLLTVFIFYNTQNSDRSVCMILTGTPSWSRVSSIHLIYMGSRLTVWNVPIWPCSSIAAIHPEIMSWNWNSLWWTVRVISKWRHGALIFS